MPKAGPVQIHMLWFARGPGVFPHGCCPSHRPPGLPQLSVCLVYSVLTHLNSKVVAGANIDMN